MDLIKDSSKQGLSVQDHGGSSKGEKIKPFTHLISLPLAIYPKLHEEVNGFRESIVGKNKEKLVEFQSTLEEMRVQESMFASPSLLHVTVVMLKLNDNTALVKAKDTLEKISDSVWEALDNRPVSIQLKGLACMEESLDETQVLYAPVEEVGNEGRLLSACHVMIDALVPDKLAAEEVKSSLKLHATMMNVIYRRDKSKGETFDAREIHKVFEKKNWGVYEIKKADLSRRDWFDAEGYYHSDGSLTFPTS